MGVGPRTALSLVNGLPGALQVLLALLEKEKDPRVLSMALFGVAEKKLEASDLFEGDLAKEGGEDEEKPLSEEDLFGDKKKSEES